MSTTDELLWERWDDVDRLLDQVLDQPEDRRAAFLAEHAGTDRPLHDLVQRLLRQLAASPDRPQAPADSLVHQAFAGGNDGQPASELAPGDTVGRYVIVQFRGRGGMATVYEAHRADGTFEQRVAIKVLRRGLDTDDLVARFLTERQILSSLTHPNVARVLDGGALPDGRPYLVMELVEGQPITTYADARQLPVRARLDLFVDAANAVHAAHRQLVVHRNIKPSNILVSDEGHVKLLDFGIAKLLHGDSAHTATGVRLLTPEYASPEQLRGDRITTGSDIYQLGLLLRELITAVQPMAGDLDIIVRTALRDTPEARYASAEELAEDVRRFLRGRPIRAHPESTRYLVRKFLARHRWILPATVVSLLAVIAFVAALTQQNRRLEQERDAAQLASRRAEATESFLVDMLRSPDPTGATSANNRSALTVVDALQQGRARLDTELADQPEVQAALLSAIGITLSGLGRSRSADTVLQHSLQLHTQQFGALDDRTLGVMREIGLNHRRARFVSAADSVFRDELNRRIARGPVPDTTRAHLLGLISSTQLQLGIVDSALDYASRAEGTLRVAGDTTSAHYAGALGALAPALRGAERFDSAETVYGVVLRQQLSDSTAPQYAIATTYNNLAFLQKSRGDLTAAEASYGRARRRLIATMGEGHPTTVVASNNLSAVLENMGRFDDVIALDGEIVRAVEAQWPNGDWQIGAAHLHLGRFHLRRDEPSEALAPLRRGWQSYVQTLGPEHAWTIVAEAQLGMALIAARRVGEGEPHLDHAYSWVRALPDSLTTELRGILEQIVTYLKANGSARQAARFEALLPTP